MPRRKLFLSLLAVCVFGLAAAGPRGPVAAEPDEEVPKAIFRYVERPEPVYGWRLVRSVVLPGGTVHALRLTSQKWHGVVWEHALEVCVPTEAAASAHALLLVTGGSQPPKLPSKSDLALGLKLARLCGAPVAVLHQVPNQPLLDGRKEDDLISETWLKYLKTGDETWPLLFPMVKSAVKAMDAVQEFSEQKLGRRVERFVITGASKRGWTSWLTAVVDERLVGTAPMVIDVLNFRPQMKHQLDTWGQFSEQIHDYTSKGLVKLGPETPRETRLRRMVDPYTYRKRLTLPKLVINGTNDRYWVVDATSLYWDDLLGPKYALFIPNAGHGLEGGHDLVVRTVAAFFRQVTAGKTLPQVEWRREDSPDRFRLVVTSRPRPEAARLWVARAETLDFREARWTAQSLDAGERLVASVPRPASGHVAFYVELQFSLDDVPYSLCTLVQRP